MRTNKFLNEKVKELGISAKEFAKMVGISYDYARQLLAPNSKRLPSDELAKRIVDVLKLSDEEEATFWKLLEEDRDELEGEEPEPELPPTPPPSENEEIEQNLKKLFKQVEQAEDWIKEVEEMFWQYREKDMKWAEKIETKIQGMKEESKNWREVFERKIKSVEETIRSLGEKQEELAKKFEGNFKKIWWGFLALVGVGGILFFVFLFLIGVLTI